MALSIRDLLTTWRDLEHELDRLATDDERAEDIRSEIELLRGAYRQMTDASNGSHIPLASSQATLERAREVLRRHFLGSWSEGRRAMGPGVDWARVIERLLREHEPDGRGCRSCGRLPRGMAPGEHQAAIIAERLGRAGVVPRSPRR
jgi:hypothetical protein